MDATRAFEAIKKIAQSSTDPADVKAMRARAPEVVNQFREVRRPAQAGLRLSVGTSPGPSRLDG